MGSVRSPSGLSSAVPFRRFCADPGGTDPTLGFDPYAWQALYGQCRDSLRPSCCGKGALSLCSSPVLFGSSPGIRRSRCVLRELAQHPSSSRPHRAGSGQPRRKGRASASVLPGGALRSVLRPHEALCPVGDLGSVSVSCLTPHVVT